MVPNLLSCRSKALAKVSTYTDMHYLPSHTKRTPLTSPPSPKRTPLTSPPSPTPACPESTYAVRGRTCSGAQWEDDGEGCLWILFHCRFLNLPLHMVSSNPGITVGGGDWGGSRRRTSVSPSRWCLRALTLSNHWPVPMESPCYWLHPWQYSIFNIFITYCIHNLHY